jgi:hypothetical protein
MTEWVIPLPGNLVEQLAASIQQGPVLEIKDGKGLRLLTEETVARINGLKLEIFSNEHPPPHFRVKYQSSTANYQISDCSRLNGNGEVLKYEKNIRLWWQDNKDNLIESWNRLRPSDCPVGEYNE